MNTNTLKKAVVVLMLALSAVPAFAEFNDPDDDGIPTRYDACPFSAGTDENNGCPDQNFAPHRKVVLSGGGGDIIVFDVIDSVADDQSAASSGGVNVSMSDGSVRFIR